MKNAIQQPKKQKVVNHDVKIAQWFETATQKLDDVLFRPLGYQVPKNIRIMVAPIKKSKNTSANTTLGVCHPSSWSHGVNIIHLNISTTDKTDSVNVLATLIHELIHAIDDNKSGHKKGGAFDKMARAVGLDGMLTATYAGKELESRLNKLIKEIGKFPAQAVSLEGLRSDTCRNIKLECSGTDDVICDHGFNINRQRIEEMTTHKCLSCGEGEYMVKLPQKYNGLKIAIEQFFMFSGLVLKSNKNANMEDINDFVSVEVDA